MIGHLILDNPKFIVVKRGELINFTDIIKLNVEQTIEKFFKNKFGCYRYEKHENYSIDFLVKTCYKYPSLYKFQLFLKIDVNTNQWHAMFTKLGMNDSFVKVEDFNYQELINRSWSDFDRALETTQRRGD